MCIRDRLGITKADVCRCHGTFEHGIFRRDTTPEYCEGDRCRPPSQVPVVHRRESPKAESDLVKDEPRSARSRDNDNYGKPSQSHILARGLEQSSAERQYNPPGGQSNLTGSKRDVEHSKSRKCEATSVKKRGDPSSPSSGDDSSDEDRT